jgi:LacI family transcriptional regulator
MTTETAISPPQSAKAQTPHRVTIGTVADLAGVSTATVSNVINNTGSVSEATKQRVRAVIQRTQWTPNVDARNLARSAAEKVRVGKME